MRQEPEREGSCIGSALLFDMTILFNGRTAISRGPLFPAVIFAVPPLLSRCYFAVPE